MTVVLAVVAGVFAWKWFKWKMISESAIYWILERHPDFTAENLREAQEARIRKALRS